MKAAIRDLSVLSYAAGFTLWLYRAKSFGEVVNAGFFDPVSDMIREGDMIHVSAPDGGGTLYVSEIADQHVSVAFMARTA